MLAFPLLIALILFTIGLLVLLIAAWYKVFEKAGQPGWAAILPVYNVVIMLRVAGKPWWWIFIFFVPVMGQVYAVWMYFLIAKSFGKDEWFTAGMVLLSFVFVPILGFGSAEYLGPAGGIPEFTTDRTN